MDGRICRTMDDYRVALEVAMRLEEKEKREALQAEFKKIHRDMTDAVKNNPTNPTIAIGLKNRLNIVQQNIERLPPMIQPRRQPHDFNADTSLAVLMSKMELEDEYPYGFLPPLERLHIANWMSELPGYPSVKHLMPQVLADAFLGSASPQVNRWVGGVAGLSEPRSFWDIFEQ